MDSRLKNALIGITLIFLMVAGGFLANEYLPIEPITPPLGAWFSDYNYRKFVNITGETGAGVNYQVPLVIGSSSGGNFNLEGHCVDFPNDIRFTDNDETTELDYFIENETADPITVWVNVTDNLDSDQTIYCYYGKSGVSTTSNGNTTFPFFDHFNGADINSSIWNESSTGGGYSVANSYLTVYGPKIETVKTWIGYGPDIAIHFGNLNVSHTLTSGVYLYAWARNVTEDSLFGMEAYTSTAIRYRAREGGAQSTGNFAGYLDRHNYVVKWKDNIHLKFYQDTTLNWTDAIYVENDPMFICLEVGGNSATADHKIAMDYIFTRKYVDPEPEFDVAGDEESTGGNLISHNLPTNGATETQWLVEFEYTVDYVDTPLNACLRIFNSTDNSLYATIWNASPLQDNVQYNYGNYTFSTEQAYKWECEYYNTSEDSWKTPSNWTLTIDIPPNIKNVGDNTTNGNVPEGDAIYIHSQGYDGIGLDYAWLWTNETGGDGKNYTQPINIYKVTIGTPRFVWGNNSAGYEQGHEQTDMDPCFFLSADNTLVALWTHKYTAEIYYRYYANSTDGGQTWSEAKNWTDHFDGVGITEMHYGEVTRHPSGKYILVQKFSNASIYSYQSNDGFNWENSTLVYANTTGTDTDLVRPFVLANNDTLCCYLNKTGYDMWINKSTDQGESWSDLYHHTCENTEVNDGNPRYVQIDQFPNGTVIMLWYQTGQDEERIRRILSNDNGTTWGSEAIIVEHAVDSPNQEDRSFGFEILTGNENENDEWYVIGRVTDNQGIQGWDQDRILAITKHFHNGSTVYDIAIDGYYRETEPHFHKWNDTHYIWISRFDNNTKGVGTDHDIWVFDVNFTFIAGNVYGSPIDLSDVADTWTWANFTWQNSSIKASTNIQYETFYNDTYGNINSTALRNFNVTAPEYDPVDLDDTDVDSSADKGTHENFTAQTDCVNSEYDTLIEENVGGSTTISQLWVDGFTADNTSWTEVGASPYLSSSDYPTNYIWEDAVDNDVEGRFNFTDGTIGIINEVKICIYATQDSGDDGNIQIYLRNSSGNFLIVDFEPTAGSWGWTNTTCTTTLPNFAAINATQMDVVAQRDGGPDILYVDSALLWVNYTSIRYQLDLEVRWTNANYTQSDEQLCIKTGAFNTSEDIQIKIWNNSQWNWVMNLTASTWNNISVSTYLYYENFTIQYLGGTETGDTQRSSWKVDCALLHTWEAAVTPSSLSVGWNNITAWAVDVGKTLSQLNCSLHENESPSVNFTQITLQYANGSRYHLIVGWGGDVTVPVQNTNTFIYILCNEADTWSHDYSGCT